MLLIEKICIFVIMPKNLKNVFFTKHKNTTKLSYFSIHFLVVFIYLLIYNTRQILSLRIKFFNY